MSINLETDGGVCIPRVCTVRRMGSRRTLRGILPKFLLATAINERQLWQLVASRLLLEIAYLPYIAF